MHRAMLTALLLLFTLGAAQAAYHCTELAPALHDYSHQGDQADGDHGHGVCPADEDARLLGATSFTPDHASDAAPLAPWYAVFLDIQPPLAVYPPPVDEDAGERHLFLQTARLRL